MKRLAILAILAAFILGTVATASAVDIKAKGSWRVHANWIDNKNFQDGDDPNTTAGDGNSEDDFAVYQRARVWFDFVASENVKAVLGLEIGDSRWGQSDTGAGLGADKTVIEVKQAYLDFNVPNSEVNVKAGVQWVELPSNLGSSIIGGDMAALVVSTPFNDMISLTAGYARPVDLNAEDSGENANDEVDVIFLALPINADGIALTPFYATAFVGQDSNGTQNGKAPLAGLEAINATGLADNVNAWWAGASVKVDMLDPIVILADLNYGRFNADKDQNDRAGWYFDLAIDYKMDIMTPELFFIYSTGDDDDPTDGSETMPSLYTESFGPTSFGFAGSSFAEADAAITGAAGVGLGICAVGLKLKGMSFMENMSHDFIVMYAKGTTDKDLVDKYKGEWDETLTEKDSLWEVDFNTKYQMYENLAAIVELGYVKVNYDEDLGNRTTTTRSDYKDEAAWKLAVGFKYDF